MHIDYIDALYTEVLEAGFRALREAVALGESDWVNAEIEVLHNIPSLIGELNWARHDYFIEKEWGAYVDWVKKSNCENAGFRMRTFYEQNLAELGRLIEARQRGRER